MKTPLIVLTERQTEPIGPVLRDVDEALEQAAAGRAEPASRARGE